MWALGNFSGDSPIFRNKALKLGALDPLLQIVHNSNNSRLIKHGTWAISNLTRGRPQPKLNLVKNAIPVLCALLMKETEAEILTYVAWSLFYLSSAGVSVSGILISSGIVPHLIRHLK